MELGVTIVMCTLYSYHTLRIFGTSIDIANKESRSLQDCRIRLPDSVQRLPSMKSSLNTTRNMWRLVLTTLLRLEGELVYPWIVVYFIFAHRKGRVRKTPAGSGDFKKQSVKYTAQKLHEKGVILEIEGLPSHQYVLTLLYWKWNSINNMLSSGSKMLSLKSHRRMLGHLRSLGSFLVSPWKKSNWCSRFVCGSFVYMYTCRHFLIFLFCKCTVGMCLVMLFPQLLWDWKP